jgi:hypothetical protein
VEAIFQRAMDFLLRLDARAAVTTAT